MRRPWYAVVFLVVVLAWTRAEEAPVYSYHVAMVMDGHPYFMWPLTDWGMYVTDEIVCREQLTLERQHSPQRQWIGLRYLAVLDADGSVIGITGPSTNIED